MQVRFVCKNGPGCAVICSLQPHAFIDSLSVNDCMHNGANHAAVVEWCSGCSGAAVALVELFVESFAKRTELFDVDGDCL